MGWALFLGFVGLLILIAAPLQTVGAMIGAVVGYQFGYESTGQGAGIAFRIFGFLAGVGTGNALHAKFMPNWKPSGDDVLAYAILGCVAAAVLVGILLIGGFIANTWSVK